MRTPHLDGRRVANAAGSVGTRLSITIGVAACIAIAGWSSVAGRPLPATIQRPPYLKTFARPTTIPYPQDNKVQRGTRGARQASLLRSDVVQFGPDFVCVVSQPVVVLG